MPIIAASAMSVLASAAIYAYAAKRRAEKDREHQRVQERLDAVTARLMGAPILTQPEG